MSYEGCMCTTVARESHEIFWLKNLHKVFEHVKNLRDQFATSSRHENSHDTRATLAKSATKFAKQSQEIRMPVRYLLKRLNLPTFTD